MFDLNFQKPLSLKIFSFLGILWIVLAPQKCVPVEKEACRLER